MAPHALKSVAPQLATPTDLKPEDTEAISQALTALVADSLALFVKTKNFHWHLSGPRFRDYHLLFDEHAESILESVDKLAERARRIGGTTLRSIGQISQLQSIQDDNEEFVPAGEMIERLLRDNRQMAEKQRAAIALCERGHDTPTSNVLQEILDQTEKRAWFLFEASQGESGAEKRTAGAGR